MGHVRLDKENKMKIFGKEIAPETKDVSTEQTFAVPQVPTTSEIRLKAERKTIKINYFLKVCIQIWWEYLLYALLSQYQETRWEFGGPICLQIANDKYLICNTVWNYKQARLVKKGERIYPNYHWIDWIQEKLCRVSQNHAS